MACVSTRLIISPRLPSHSNFSLLKKKSLIHHRSSLDHYSFPRIITRRVSSPGHGISSVRGAMKQGGVVESDKIPKDVRKRAMKAVDECADLRVSVDDVASKGGLTFTEAQIALQALAADTDGFLEFSDKGDVLYVLPRDYRSKLSPFLYKAKVVVHNLIHAIVYTVIIVIIFDILHSLMAVYCMASFAKSLHSPLPKKTEFFLWLFVHVLWFIHLVLPWKM